MHRTRDIFLLFLLCAVPPLSQGAPQVDAAPRNFQGHTYSPANGPAAASQSQSGQRVSIAPIKSHPYGHTYGEWIAKWWQWALELPADVNPILDTTGVNCNEGQLEHVWFLADTLGSGTAQRNCVVPANTALFFPLISTFYGAFLNDSPETRTEAYLRSVAASCVNVDFAAEIDGVDIRNAAQYFAQSPLFDVQLPDNNLFGLGPDVIPELRLSPSVAQGYFLFLRPLPPGPHTIHWSSSQNCPFGDFAEDVTYRLLVKKSR